MFDTCGDHTVKLLIVHERWCVEKIKTLDIKLSTTAVLNCYTTYAQHQS
jgi:hypothetical protein